MTNPASSPSLMPESASEGLARSLFGPAFDFAAVHEPWRALLGDNHFHYQRDLSTTERTELSYQRLHRINSNVDSPFVLAMDPARLAGLHEWLTVADGTAASLASIHYNLFMGSIVEAHHDSRRDLDDVTAMRATGVFLCSEIGHGNDAAELETTATRDPDTGGYVLHSPTESAHKFMPNSSRVGGQKVGVVAARLISDGVDHGPYLFLTPLSDSDGNPLPGVRVRPLPERIGTPLDHCVTAFDRVQLPAEALLEGKHGQISSNGTFTSNLSNPRQRFLASIARVTPGKLCMSAAAIGVARASLAIAVNYAHHRHISGFDNGLVPIAAHRSHHERLISRLATAFAMTYLHRQTLRTWAAHDDDNRKTAERDVAIAKAWITWHGREIATESRERCGAHGMFPLNGIAHHAQNVDGAITAEGDNLAISVKAAAQMLRARQAPRTALALGSLNRDQATLRDLYQVLTAAEAIPAHRAHVRLRASTKHGLDRWNEVSLSALEAVSARAACHAAQAFLNAIEECDNPQARLILEELCRQFLLRQIQERASVLLAEGHLSAPAGRQLPDAIEASVARLAPHMLTCVNSFKLPEDYLASIPIAGANYQAAYGD
ncbi:acyl-CoA dehydrogenase [Streptomyces sp. MS1.AVA.3]|uniref:acyl-CoA dehydrogenase family protein n=1 Tax=Streptomyces decoyicus TaxID=249567 RepID=UPI0030C01413